MEAGLYKADDHMGHQRYLKRMVLVFIHNPLKLVNKEFFIFLACLAMLPLVAAPAQFVASRACPTQIREVVTPT